MEKRLSKGQLHRLILLTRSPRFSPHKRSALGLEYRFRQSTTRHILVLRQRFRCAVSSVCFAHCSASTAFQYYFTCQRNSLYQFHIHMSIVLILASSDRQLAHRQRENLHFTAQPGEVFPHLQHTDKSQPPARYCASPRAWRNTKAFLNRQPQAKESCYTSKHQSSSK